ncbi:MAG: hypothetical protein ACI9JL_004522 [Paracoccaceae bacterium]|jgi:hypothetical protein
MDAATLRREWLLARYDEYTEAIEKDPDLVTDDVKRLVRVMEDSGGPLVSNIRMVTPPKRKRRQS